MASGKFQGTTPANEWPEKQLFALRIPFLDGLDPLFREKSDAKDDFLAAYERALDFTAVLGQTRVAFLWQHALKIGFQAGHGGATERVRDCKASEEYACGREVGLKEGRTSGLRDGKQDVLRCEKSSNVPGAPFPQGWGQNVVAIFVSRQQLNVILVPSPGNVKRPGFSEGASR
ncbi:hypothetical protein B0H13DRAFT_1910299 [Mycena leptocephala]|nr:hypothetical protein B0H13DRAFT_1910299 [Mycena leptocephala]